MDLDRTHIPDAERTSVDEVLRFLRSIVETSPYEHVILPLDGSVGAAVTAILADTALTDGTVHGLVIDERNVETEDRMTLLAEGLGIDYHVVDVTTIQEDLRSRFVDAGVAREGWTLENDAKRVILAAIVHTIAVDRDWLVLGPESRTELLLETRPAGLCSPLGNLFASELRTVARSLGMPDRVVDQLSLLDDLPALRAVGLETIDLPILDATLFRLVDVDVDVGTIASEVGLPVDRVRTIAAIVSLARRFRLAHPTPRSWSGDRYERFHELELQFGSTDTAGDRPAE